VAKTLDLDLLQRAREAVNADPAFRRLGTADVRVGVRHGEAAFLIAFEAFECAAVEQVDENRLRDADFVIERSAVEWDRWLAARGAGKAPSLLSLDVDAPAGIVRGRDPRQTLAFERYAASLQAYFDKSAELAA
jgi:hypothetical protein